MKKILKHYFPIAVAGILALSAQLSSLSFAANEQPDIFGEMAITIDVDTGEIIYAKNIDQKGYPASTTKIITALLFAENANINDTLVYTESAKAQPSYSLNTDYGPLQIGYEMSADMAMKALLIYSANDIAYMIADTVAGDADSFMAMVNQRFQQLGLRNTHFTTANGTHDVNHYTTAYEMSVITREAFKNPWVINVLSQAEAIIEVPRGTIPVSNSNQKLTNNGLILSKTGYTRDAGRCLVSIYERDGRRIVGVVLNSQFDAEDTIVFQDMDLIMDWSFEKAKKMTYLEPSAYTHTVSLTYKPIRFLKNENTIELPIHLHDSVSYYPNTVNNAEISYSIAMFDYDAYSLSKDTPIGEIIITQREHTQKLSLYPGMDTDDIKALHKTLYMGLTIGAIIGGILLIIILFSVIAFTRNAMGRGRKSKLKF